MYGRYIHTLDFSYVPIRKTHTDGKFYASISLSNGENVEIRLDYRTNQPFAVLFDGDWNEL